MLHRSCDDSTIANNEAYLNGDAGAAIFETSNTKIFGNNFHDNRCKGMTTIYSYYCEKGLTLAVNAIVFWRMYDLPQL